MMKVKSYRLRLKAKLETNHYPLYSFELRLRPFHEKGNMDKSHLMFTGVQLYLGWYFFQVAIVY